jgi:hypothetical protein
MQSDDIDIDELPVGAVLALEGGRRRGIYMGNEWVFENSRRFGARLVRYADFEGSGAVLMTRLLQLTPETLFKRVKAALAKNRPYCAITNNREHLINRIEHGFGFSALTALWISLVAVAAVPCAIALANEKRA